MNLLSGMTGRGLQPGHGRMSHPRPPVFTPSLANPTIHHQG
ncbi:hypothetical protein [Azospirillum endophyticum]